MSSDSDAFMMRRTLRTLRGLYVYVGVLPARDFIGNIAESVGEPVALIHRSVREDPQPVTAPGPVLDQNIVRKGVGLPAATADAPKSSGWKCD